MKLDKETVPIIISIVALLVSGLIFFFSNLKWFSLKIEEGASLTIAKYKDTSYILGCPFIFINKGARGGTVKSFVLHIKNNKNSTKPNATLLFEISEFEHPSKNPKLLMPIYLKGNENKLIIIGRELQDLKIGKYNCELIAILDSNKKVRRSFSFPIIESALKAIDSGIVTNIPTSEILKIDKY